MPVTVPDHLVREAAEGKQPALNEVLDRSAGLARAMATARLTPRGDHAEVAEELAQTALIALSQGLPRLDDRTWRGLKSYLSGIVSHAVTDFLRAASKRPGTRSLDSRVELGSEVTPLARTLAASTLGPMGRAENRELHALLIAELGGLESRQRTALTMAFVDQLLTDEIGRALNISRRAAAMLLLRAVTELRHRVRRALARQR